MLHQPPSENGIFSKMCGCLAQKGSFVVQSPYNISCIYTYSMV